MDDQQSKHKSAFKLVAGGVAIGVACLAVMLMRPGTSQDKSPSLRTSKRLDSMSALWKVAAERKLNGDYEGAIESFSALYNTYPTSLAVDELAYLYLHQGQRTEAYALLAKAVRKNLFSVSDRNLNFVYAELCGENGDIEGERDAYFRILEKRRSARAREALEANSANDIASDQEVAEYAKGKSLGVPMSLKPGGKLSDESMLHVYLAVSKSCSADSLIDCGKRKALLKKAVSLASSSIGARERYELSERCQDAGLKSERIALLKQVAGDPSSSVYKSLAVRELAPAEKARFGKPVLLPAPAHVVKEFKESLRHRQEGVDKRARQWDAKNKRPIPWPSETRAKTHSPN